MRCETRKPVWSSSHDKRKEVCAASRLTLASHGHVQAFKSLAGQSEHDGWGNRVKRLKGKHSCCGRAGRCPPPAHTFHAAWRVPGKLLPGRGHTPQLPLNLAGAVQNAWPGALTKTTPQSSVIQDVLRAGLCSLKVHMLKLRCPVSLNVTVFGDSVFKDVIKMNKVRKVSSNPI